MVFNDNESGSIASSDAGIPKAIMPLLLFGSVIVLILWTRSEFKKI